MKTVKNKNEKGFTLVEMLVSVFIVSFSLVAIFNLNSKYSQQTKQEKESFVASLLAQEGAEIIKNMRDTNWVKGNCWYEGIVKTGMDSDCLSGTALNCTTNGCEIDYNDSGLTDWGSVFIEDNDPSGGNYLYIESGGLYGYDTTDAVWTPYRRRIVLVVDSPYELTVRSIVYWNKKKVEVVQKILDWRNHNEN